MNIVNIKQFKPDNSQSFIIDTNVLIKILYPLLSSKSTEDYENLYVQLIKNKAKILMSSIQISEFVNRCIRFQFDLWKEEQEKDVEFKKDYRSTDDYRDSMHNILDIIKHDITPKVIYIDDQFSKMNIDILYQYGFSYDFNDSLLTEITRLNKAILITDDRDFANYSSDIVIVTGNKTLLMFK